MAQDRTDPLEQIPEEDLLEQQTSLDGQPLTDAATEPALADPPLDTADEADLLEQQTALPDDDEDEYPHQPTAHGSS